MMKVKKIICTKCKKEILTIQPYIENLSFCRDMIISKGYICEVVREYFDGIVKDVIINCSCGERTIKVKEQDQAYRLVNEKKVFDLLNDFKIGKFCDTLKIIDSNENYDD